MEPVTFSFGARLGLVFIIESALLSAISTSVMLGYVIYNAFKNMYHPPPIGHRRFHFVRSALDYFFLSLLFWDFILALGAVMNIRWVHQAGITTGSFCTAQGVLKQIGAVGVAFSSAAIAIYTFLVIFARWQIPNTRWLPLTITGLITLFLILLPIIGSRINTDPPYYGPSTYWCWISPNYGSERVGLEYGLIWFISALSIALYVPLFFVLRGNLQVDYQQRVGSSGRKMKISWKSIRSGGGDSQQGDDKKESTTIAKQMLAYPIAYIICILPMSIIRWIEPTRGTDNPLASEWTAFAGIIYSSSGLVNVLLYLLTRPAMFPSWRSCRRRIGGRNEKAGAGAGNSFDDGRTGAMPEMTTHNVVLPSASGHVDSQSAVPPTWAVTPPTSRVPMLTDDDDTDYERYSASHGCIPSPTSPTAHSAVLHGFENNSHALAVPKLTDRNSWTSEGSKHGISIQEGSGYSHGVPALK